MFQRAKLSLLTCDTEWKEGTSGYYFYNGLTISVGLEGPVTMELAGTPFTDFLEIIHS